MLGFLPLSTEPLSSVIAEVFRLESSAQLDSISITSGEAILKYLISAQSNALSELYSNEVVSYKLISTLESYSDLISVSSIQLPETSILLNNSNISFDLLTKTHAATSLDVISTTVFNEYLTSKINSVFTTNSEISEFGKIQFKLNSNLDVANEIIASGYPRYYINSELDSSVNFTGVDFLRTIGNTLLGCNVEISDAATITSYLDLSLNQQAELLANPISVSRLYSEFDIISVFTTNLSRRDRDIVYYILAIQKESPFDLKILRIK